MKPATTLTDAGVTTLAPAHVEPAGTWFDQAACGVFFHWGPYSVAARGEWVMNRELISVADYQRNYIDGWNVDQFDADAWMRVAREFGADYIIFTARHHDGFAMWNSPVNPRNSAVHGPRRDFVAEITAAAHRAGLKVGLYYSIANWAHPDYPSAGARDWPSDEDWRSPAHRRRFQSYVSAELSELLGGAYGRIDYLWYDGHFPANIRDASWNALARRLQPGILINDRNSPDGDVKICEQSLRADPPKGRWEACFTLNRNWGFHASDHAYKAPLDLLDLLLKIHADKGRLLLNIGPRGDGGIPDESTRIMRVCGEWIRGHRRILNELETGVFSWNNSALIARRGHSVLLFFNTTLPREFCWAETDAILLEALDFVSGRTILFRQNGVYIRLFNLDKHCTSGLLPVVELRFASKPEPVTPNSTFWIPG
ncbi:MAG: alpha-L-fucosidase [Opitutaceae bacterium]|nr:alpha-L-fucosidase [Opitutaceae bacterium]